MYKIIFIDIDGTLITSDRKISPGTLSTIERITQVNKIPVILTTARPPQAVEAFYRELNLKHPAVCFNGALILNDFNLKNEQGILRSIPIDPVFLSTITNTAAQYKVTASFYTSGNWVAGLHDERIKREERATKTRVTVTDVPSQIKNWESINSGPHKVLIMGEPGEINTIETVLKNNTQQQLNIYKSKTTYLEIMHHQASKSTAINFLLDRYGLTSKEVMAIGDNYNDIEMLQFAGLGIAMGNAPEEVKAYADFVTADNNSEGISLAIDKFIK